MVQKLAVSEVFYSIQGEGKTMGVPSVFVRLAGCNLMCGGQGTQFDGELHNGALWRCDTVEVWMSGKSKPVNEIIDDECVKAIKKGAHVILTGGEPMMQQKPLLAFIEYLHDNINPDVFIEVETNGTVMPSDEMFRKINLWNCSPKLLSSGNSNEQTFKPDVIKRINLFNAIFKFVVQNDTDWLEIMRDYFSIINKEKIWLMPAGENQELLNKNKQTVVELAKKYYLNFTTRLHIEIWNKKTGV